MTLKLTHELYMLHRLRDVLNNDFIEYNSRPYQNFTDNAIDYLAAVVALARESDWAMPSPFVGRLRNALAGGSEVVADNREIST